MQGYLVHDDDPRCGSDPQISCASGDGVKCYSSPAQNATGSACGDRFYQCSAGQPYPLQNVAPGTLCYAGGLIASNDATCAGTASTAPPTGGVVCSFELAGMDPLTASQVSQSASLRLAFATALGIPIDSVYIDSVNSSLSTTSSSSGGSGGSRVLLGGHGGAGVRRVRGSSGSSNSVPHHLAGFSQVNRFNQPQSRWLNSYLTTTPITLDYVPPTPPLDGVPVSTHADIVGSLGSGSSVITLRVMGHNSSSLISALSSGNSALVSSALVQSGIAVVVGAPSSPSIVPVPSSSPTSTRVGSLSSSRTSTPTPTASLSFLATTSTTPTTTSSGSASASASPSASSVVHRASSSAERGAHWSTMTVVLSLSACLVSTLVLVMSQL